MRDDFPNLARCISIVDRLMKMYYDRGLADFEIGWGQQFFAEYIYVSRKHRIRQMPKRLSTPCNAITRARADSLLPPRFKPKQNNL